MRQAYYPPVLALLSILAFWQIITSFFNVPSYLFPSPNLVVSAAFELGPDLFGALGETLTSTLAGLALGGVIAFPLALILSTSQVLRSAILPLAIFFQTVPIIAIAPLLVIWFGFGAPTVRASAAIVCFFPLLSNALQGFTSTPVVLIQLFEVYRANTWQRLFFLNLPSAWPSLCTGLRVGSGLAVVGAIVGEFVGGGGLGQFIDSARAQQRTDVVFAAVGLASLLGFFMVLAVDLFARIQKRS